MAQGWIAICRQLQEHWLWEEKPFSKGHAWIDLLMLANYEDKKIPYKGKIITCERGTVNLSILFLAERWGWSRHKTRDFLTLLENDKMVTVNATTNRTTITIENYALYNDVPATKGQRKDSERTTKGQRADTTNKDNNINKDNNNNNIKHKYGEYKNVLLTDEELEKLKAEYPDWEERIERLSSYVASTGKSYKSHYATIRNWARKDKKGESVNAGNRRIDTEPAPERRLGTYI